MAAAGARAAAREGARVYVISLERDECEGIVDEIDGEGFSAADLSVEDQASAAFESAHSALGGIDGLFAAAGASGRRFGDGPVDSMSLGAWEDTLRINAVPAFLAARESVRAMRGRGGSVVLMGSVLASSPSPRHFATHGYAAAKGAINSLTTALAASYAGQGIRVNAIAPGLVSTPMSERAAGDPRIIEYAIRKQPLAGGLLQPGDVVGAVTFLLSDESAMMTGQVVTVDGGWSITEA